MPSPWRITFVWHCWGLKRLCVSQVLSPKILTIEWDEFERVENSCSRSPRISPWIQPVCMAKSDWHYWGLTVEIYFTYVNSPIPTSQMNALCPWEVDFLCIIYFRYIIYHGFISKLKLIDHLTNQIFLSSNNKGYINTVQTVSISLLYFIDMRFV